MSNSISSYSNYNGISGLVSGLDTESMVKKAIAGELAKVNKIKADKQLATWKQESYHNIMDKISDFTSKYHDVMNTDSYI
jgi:flagellar hook-associated protein 2